MPPLLRLALLGSVALSLAGCANTIDRLKNIGEAPKLSSISDPTAQPGYKPVQMPMPAHESVAFEPNSLWRTGSRSFFKDQRAARVGDLLTVHIGITDQAKIQDTTTRGRTNSEDMGISHLAGLESKAGAVGVDPSHLLSTDSNSASQGTGSVDRSEAVTTNVAAVVTQVLPNGNLVIEGRQEIRVNFEMRELIVAGIVRPEDIASDNTIDSTKIAEARIAYGGRGQITDVQQPRYGQQALDILLPF
ncbi:MAG TPA: flagellar basal body L-ring protein FlgH [Hyphomicrobiales bacterium]|nr:flagellar basal body L-ring protein FlgH [Hyphomicrobiales bacterium]